MLDLPTEYDTMRYVMKISRIQMAADIRTIRKYFPHEVAMRISKSLLKQYHKYVGRSDHDNQV